MSASAKANEEQTATVISGPENGRIFHCMQIKHALRLELVGLKHSSGSSVAPLADRYMGRETMKRYTRARKAWLLSEFDTWLEAEKVRTLEEIAARYAAKRGEIED